MLPVVRLASAGLCLLCLLGALAASPSAAAAVEEVVPQLVSHAPIMILSDADFTSANGVTGGTGTSADPYLIEGWDIAAGASGSVSIGYTSAYFVVRDLRATCAPSSTVTGIALDQAPHGLLENVTVQGCGAGIAVGSSSDVRLVASRVASAMMPGIQVSYSTQIVIQDSDVGSAGDGIRLDTSSYVNVSGNRLHDNGNMGLYALSASNLTAYANTVEGNRFGIGVYQSGGVRLLDNWVANNTEEGIYVDSSYDLGITWNRISNNREGVYLSNSLGSVHHNTFLDNGHQSGDTQQGFWDDGYPSGGNWWSDYLGVDRCSGPGQDVCSGPDGIGDTAYYDVGMLRDRYPLILPERRPHAAFTIDSSQVLVGDAVAFDASASFDPDGDAITYAWDFGDGVQASGSATSHAYGTAGAFVVTLTVTDPGGLDDSVNDTVQVWPTLALVPYEHPSGWRISVPQGWDVRTNENVSGTVVELIALGPAVGTGQSNFVATSETHPGVREDASFLGALLNETVAGIQQDRPEVHLRFPVEYRSAGGHAGVVFVLEYGTTSLVQKGALVASAAHGRVWLLLMTTATDQSGQLFAVFDRMVDSFSITAQPALTTYLVVGAIVGAAGAGVAFAVWRIRKRRRATSPAPGAAVVRCPSCGAESPGAARFCGRCGTPFPSGPADTGPPLPPRSP